MSNYRAQFWGFNRGPVNEGDPSEYKYRVDFIADSASSVYNEIELAGGDPVRLTYDDSETPFDAMRTSRLLVSVVVDSYLEDILPSTPHEVKVVLFNITQNKTEWVGWLSPMVLSAGYRDEFETFELQANDCLMTLQYFPYELHNGTDIQFVSFRDILGDIVDRCGLLKGFRWAMSKYSKSQHGSIIYPEQLLVNEKNWYYNDVDETIKLNEVLEELCKYIGMTAVQMGEYIYLVDYQSLGKNSTHRMVNYLKTTGYQRGADAYHGGTVTIDQDYVVGPQPSITIEPIRNKIEVKDNFYNADSFIPSIFDDELLTNRLDPENFYFTMEMPFTSPRAPSYPNGTTWGFWQDYEYDRIQDKNHPENNVYDSSYKYFFRVYDNEYYQSYYNGSSGTPIDFVTGTTYGGTIVDHAAPRNDYINEYGQTTVANKRDFTRYLMIKQNNIGTFPLSWSVQDGVLLPSYTYVPPLTNPVFKLKSGYRANVMLGTGSFLVISGSALFTRYPDRPYICPTWTTEGNKIKWNSNKDMVTAAGCLAFVLGIGGKYWNGAEWTTTRQGFWVTLERTQEDYPFWMIDSPILNNVRWDNFVNADGYKIPLDDVDTSQEIEFEVLLPSLQWYYDNTASYNGFCWIKDLSIKAYKEGQDAEDIDKDNDFTTTNIILSGSVQEMPSIELKITTANDNSSPSWSDCVYSGLTKGLLEGIYEPSITNIIQTPEQNIVQKYVDQYSQLTKKIEIDLPLSITQLNRIKGADVDSPDDAYVILGTEISFADGRQHISMIKKN